jgi:uncharacterized protein (DUF1697 family)
MTAQRYFAFLRAINTGGRRLTNEQIIGPFVGLGFRDVVAYQAAGNVCFLAEDPDEAQVSRIEAALSEAFGFDAPAFLREAGDLRSVLEAQPFTAHEMSRTEGRIQVSFLRTAPDETTLAEVHRLVPPDDRIAFVDAHWLWLPTGRISGSVLPVAAVEDVVGPMTMRTLGTVARMHQKFAT